MEVLSLAVPQGNGTGSRRTGTTGSRAKVTIGTFDGGLTTILEKSLGAVAKGGTTALRQVVDYAERPSERGLVFMDTPGYDPISVTGIVAGGANLVCFTTGRGSVFGCKPAPSLKLATTSGLYQRMSDDMDIDCGVILAGVPVAELGAQIFAELIKVASGKATKSEAQEFGEEFVPWQLIRRGHVRPPRGTFDLVSFMAMEAI